MIQPRDVQRRSCHRPVPGASSLPGPYPFATNDLPVSSGRLRYPRAVPTPPKHISPGDPTGRVLDIDPARTPRCFRWGHPRERGPAPHAPAGDHESRSCPPRWGHKGWELSPGEGVKKSAAAGATTPRRRKTHVGGDRHSRVQRQVPKSRRRLGTKNKCVHPSLVIVSWRYWGSR